MNEKNFEKLNIKRVFAELRRQKFIIMKAYLLFLIVQLYHSKTNKICIIGLH